MTNLCQCYISITDQSCLIILQERFEELRKAYPGSRLLIVSNSAGTLSDPTGAEADLLEKNTGVKVLRHNTKASMSWLLEVTMSDWLHRNLAVILMCYHTFAMLQIQELHTHRKSPS
jgi:hypothetical protein